MTPWEADAECRDHDPDISFEESRQREAKRICNGCPVKRECFDYALALPYSTMGVFAGTTESERKKLRSGKKIRSVCRTCGESVLFAVVVQYCDDCRDKRKRERQDGYVKTLREKRRANA